MVTPPFNDPLSSLRLADTFYTWYRRTNDLITKVNPIQVYGITTDTDGLSVTVNTDGIATISSVLPYEIGGDHDFIGGITFSGTPITFNTDGEHQVISYHGNATHTYQAGVDVSFSGSVTFELNCIVNFEAIVNFNNEVNFNHNTHFNQNDDGIATFYGDVVIGTESTDHLHVFSGTSFENHVVFTDSVTHNPLGMSSKIFQHMNNIVKFDYSQVEFDGNSNVNCYADATFRDEVDMYAGSTLSLHGAIMDKNNSPGLENNVLTSDGDGKVVWTAQSGGGGGDGNGEIASKIVSISPLNWITTVAQKYFAPYNGDNPNSEYWQPEQSDGNIHIGDNIPENTKNVFTDFDVPDNATHIIIGSQMSVNYGAMQSLQYNTGTEADSTTSRVLCVIGSFGDEDGVFVNNETIVPVSSNGDAHIWFSGEASPGFHQAWVAGYIIPASAAGGGDSSQFLIDNQYFNSDSTDPFSSDTPADDNDTPTTDFVSVLGTLIATGGDVINDYTGGYVHTELNWDRVELRGSNAMLSISGSIEFDPKRRHKWEFWVSPTAVEIVPPTDANGKKWSKIVTTTPESTGQLDSNSDRYNSFSIDIPVIDIPMSGPMYLHSRVICTLNHGLAGQHLQNKCWGASYTWYGGGIGGVGVGGGGNSGTVFFDHPKRISGHIINPLDESGGVNGAFPFQASGDVGSGVPVFNRYSDDYEPKTFNLRTNGVGVPAGATSVVITVAGVITPYIFTTPGVSIPNLLIYSKPSANTTVDDDIIFMCQFGDGLAANSGNLADQTVRSSVIDSTQVTVPIDADGNITIFMAIADGQVGNNSPVFSSWGGAADTAAIDIKVDGYNMDFGSGAEATQTVLFDNAFSLNQDGGRWDVGTHRLVISDGIQMNGHYNINTSTNGIHGGDTNYNKQDISLDIPDDATHILCMGYAAERNANDANASAIWGRPGKQYLDGSWNDGIDNTQLLAFANPTVAWSEADRTSDMTKWVKIDRSGVDGQDGWVSFLSIKGGADGSNSTGLGGTVQILGYMRPARVAATGSTKTTGYNQIDDPIEGLLIDGRQSNDGSWAVVSSLYCLTPEGPHLVGSWNHGHDDDDGHDTVLSGDHPLEGSNLAWLPWVGGDGVPEAGGVGDWSNALVDLDIDVLGDITGQSYFTNSPSSAYPKHQILVTSGYPTDIGTATEETVPAGDSMFAFLRTNTEGYHGNWETINWRGRGDGGDPGRGAGRMQKYINDGYYVFFRVLGLHSDSNQTRTNGAYLKEYKWSSIK